MDKDVVYDQVAALHRSCIGQGFLATLGVPFLSLMYQAIDESDTAVLLTEQREGRIVGFVSGCVGMKAIYRRMIRSPFRLARALLPSLVRPACLAKVLDILRYDGGAASSKPDWPRAELLSIAVAPEARGSGVAETLYRDLASHFFAVGEPAFRIVVGDALQPAHRFYQRMGAIPVGRIEVHPGEGSVLYVHNQVEARELE